MTELTATRSVAMALGEERQAMREGAVFLDEKCVLLAGAMLLELRRFEAARATLRALQSRAAATLAAALGRHGRTDQCSREAISRERMDSVVAASIATPAKQIAPSKSAVER